MIFCDGGSKSFSYVAATLEGTKAVALESIKIDEVDTQGNTEIGVTKQYARSSYISVAELFGKINLSDESFIKYIPDGFLNEAQLK